jgi:PST family polysaccharide transporter
MIEIIKVITLLGMRHLSGAIYGLIRSKLLAYFIGPIGVGLFSQAKTFLQFLDQISTFGSKGGVLKTIADYKNDEDHKKLTSFIGGVLVFFGLTGTIISIVCIFFSTSISNWIFNDAQYAWIISIVSVASVFYIEYYLIYLIFQGISKWNKYFLVSIIGDIVSTLITAAAIIYWNIKGAIFSFLFCNTLLFLISFIALNRTFKEEKIPGFKSASLSISSIRQLTRFIGPLSTKAFVEYASLLLLRSEIIRQIGMNASGIFQIAYGTSILYMEIFSQLLFSYGIPKLTTHVGSYLEMNKVQNNLLRLGIIILSPLTLLLLVSRQFWIPLLYDFSFLSAASLLIWQFSGDILRIIRTSITSSLLPLERFWVININEFFYWFCWIVFMKILIPHLGILAVGVGYFLANLALLPVIFIYHYKYLGYKLSKQSIYLLLKALPLVGIGFWIANQKDLNLVSIIGTIIIIIFMIVFLPSKKDFQEVLIIIKNYRKKIA